MSVNIIALLDRAEDPEKMIDEYMRDIEADLGKVKAETASVMGAQPGAGVPNFCPNCGTKTNGGKDFFDADERPFIPCKTYGTPYEM